MRVPPGHTHLLTAAPRAATAAAAPLLPALAVCRTQPTTQPNFGPTAQPLASRVEGEREKGGQRQRRAGTLYPPGGAAAPLQLLAGREGSGRARGQPGKLAAREPGGVEREHTRRGERGALDRVGGQDQLEARDSGQTQDSTGRRDVGGGGAGQGAGVGAGEKDGPPRGFAKTGAQGCWGREAAYQGGRRGEASRQTSRRARRGAQVWGCGP